jgi:prepilin-type N-terminal cleavage/methylation domain-containing protein
MTLVEMTVALAVLAVAAGCLIQVLTTISAGQQRLAGRQAALDAAKQQAEEILQFTGDSAALYGAFNSPPDVLIRDGDGDQVFDSGWVAVTVCGTVQSIAGEAEETVKLVFGKADN